MDIVGAFIPFIIPALIIGWLMAHGETEGGLGCLGGWIVLSMMIGLTIDDDISGAKGLALGAVGSVLPALAAGIGFAMNRQSEGVADAQRAEQKGSIPQPSQSLGMLWYGGGVSGVRVMLVELLLTEGSLWFASVQPPGVEPVRVPLDAITSVEVRSDLDVSTRTDAVGGLIWGGGGARRTESVRDPKLMIHWRTPGGAVQEAEFRVNSPLPSSKGENRRASMLGTSVAEVRQVMAAIREALPRPEQIESAVAGSDAPEQDLAPCPWCAEPIQSAATICRFCDRNIETGQRMD